MLEVGFGDLFVFDLIIVNDLIIWIYIYYKILLKRVNKINNNYKNEMFLFIKMIRIINVI